MLSIIGQRRDRKTHSEQELRFLAQGAADGSIPDYQLAAWLMAAVLNPLSPQETTALTKAMADSGEKLDLRGLPKPWVDKHSTGGVGDKTTIALLPLLASCGLTLVKMSGAGLGITGGTVDKLQSLPGFRMDLSPEELVRQAQKIGVALTGQTPKLATADKALYALRDVTGTVKSIPLIASSILSKKIAGGAETVVIDLKVGSGGFMKSPEEANELAQALLAVGKSCGLNLRIALTDMNSPLGFSIGNALEVQEALLFLENKLHNRFSSLCLQLAGFTLCSVGVAKSLEDGISLAQEALDSGIAYAKALQWFAEQGANPTNVFEQLPKAKVQIPVIWNGEPGTVARISADTIGQAVVDLGGGRKKKGDPIDHSVGIWFEIEPGNLVAMGQTIATVHAASVESAQIASDSILSSIQLGEPEYKNPIREFL